MDLIVKESAVTIRGRENVSRYKKLAARLGDDLALTELVNLGLRVIRDVDETAA